MNIVRADELLRSANYVLQLARLFLYKGKFITFERKALVRVSSESSWIRRQDVQWQILPRTILQSNLYATPSNSLVY